MSKRAEQVARLKQIPRLSGLTDKDLAAIAEKAAFLHLPANWSLMSETTPADKAYLLLDGEVAIRKAGETIATVGPGGVIGEVGILEHRLRTAGVVSLSELEVVHLTKDDLTDLVDRIPALADALQSTADEHFDDE